MNTTMKEVYHKTMYHVMKKLFFVAWRVKTFAEYEYRIHWIRYIYNMPVDLQTKKDLLQKYGDIKSEMSANWGDLS